MNATIALECRFLRTPDGSVWTNTAFPYAFWTRYLSVFEHVRVVARVRDVPEAGVARRANGPRVAFHAIPDYHGPAQFVRRYIGIRHALRASINDADAVIMRVPSFLATVLEPMLRRRGKPYSLEVVGDPYDVFAPGVLRHPLRPLIRHYMTKKLRDQCRRASGVAYVTRQFLQQRYPCESLMTGVSDVELRHDSFSTHYSSIELTADQVLSSWRERRMNGRNATLAFVGTLEQLYKGPDVLIKAVADSVASGFDLTLVIAGDGRYRSLLESLAENLNIRERCHFLGQLSGGTALREMLDSADLFILPSLTEGLPRAMIEAMARALPCIGSNVGGIPELLPKADTVCPGDIAGLGRKIQEFVSDPERMIRTSQRNLAIARQYIDEHLQARRVDFYRHSKTTTADWQAGEARMRSCLFA